MAKIFWVECPRCKKKFYAAKDDFRNKDRQLLCPFCGERFVDRQAKSIIEDTA